MRLWYTKYMNDEEKIQELKKALEEYRRKTNSLKREHEEKIKKILDEIDAHKISQVKKKLGI